jgi:hypothetical protein
MSDQPVQEHVPTPEELEREAKRLARTRHLTAVPDLSPVTALTPPTVPYDLDPDPQAAA